MIDLLVTLNKLEKALGNNLTNEAKCLIRQLVNDAEMITNFNSESLNDAEDELEYEHTKIRELRKKNDSLEFENSKLNLEVEKLYDEINKLEDENADLEKKLKEVQDDLNDLEEEIEDKRSIYVDEI